jgi:hypothetical protein
MNGPLEYVLQATPPDKQTQPSDQQKKIKTVIDEIQVVLGVQGDQRQTFSDAAGYVPHSVSSATVTKVTHGV